MLSLFSGLGAFEKAMKNVNIKYKLINYCEKEKAFARAYSVIHNVSEDLNLGDICNIDEAKLSDFDLMTWGFPCVNFSKANKEENREGLSKEGSGLYYEGIRILKHKKPMYSIIENVSDLAENAKFKDDYQQIISDLSDANYNSYSIILNAEEYGLPQRRRRLFIISIRKDIDDYSFTTPKPIPLKVKAKDLFETEVDEKFLKINPVIIDRIKGINLRSTDICPTITRAIGRAGSSGEYISNCAFVYKNTGVLRRMTPKETLLFMGFDSDDYDLLKENSISDTAIFNMSGNSICVSSIEEIYKILLKDYI